MNCLHRELYASTVGDYVAKSACFTHVCRHLLVHLCPWAAAYVDLFGSSPLVFQYVTRLQITTHTSKHSPTMTTRYPEQQQRSALMFDVDESQTVINKDLTGSLIDPNIARGYGVLQQTLRVFLLVLYLSASVVV